jgi:hypothetical protein
MVATAQDPTHQADVLANIGAGQMPAEMATFPIT